MTATTTATRERPRADEAAAEEIETAIRDRLIGWVRDFRVVIRDHGVVLKGWTRSYYAKQMVQHAALAASRLPLLANEILVM
jgi:osmotically-inducible protein OsmY